MLLAANIHRITVLVFYADIIKSLIFRSKSDYYLKSLNPTLFSLYSMYTKQNV